MKGNTPSEVLLSPAQVCERIGCSVSTLNRWVKEGHFPTPLLVGKRSRRWPKQEIEEYLRSRRT